MKTIRNAMEKGKKQKSTPPNNSNRVEYIRHTYTRGVRRTMGIYYCDSRVFNHRITVRLN